MFSQPPISNPTPPSTIHTAKQRLLLGLLLGLCLPNLAHAGFFDWFSKSANKGQTSNQSEFLPAEQAFKVQHQQHDDVLTLTFAIAPGYYLYRHQLTVEPTQTQLGDWQLPEGQAHEDAYFGKSQVYKQSFSVDLPLQQVGEQGQLTLRYQGCTTDLCYAPQTLHIPLAPLAP